MLETSQLQHLVAVSDHATITEAAESLYLTQPALSRSMKKIEVDLGVELFDRTKNRIALNATGKLAADRSREILKKLEEMEQSVRENGRLEHTAAIGSCTPPLLWEMVPALAEAFPEMTFSSVIDSTPSLVKSLLSKKVQIAFLAHRINDGSICCYEWGVEQLYVVFPADHPLHDAVRVTFEELNGQSFLLQSHTGDWADVARRMMPEAKLLFQEDRSTLMNLAQNLILPRFMSDLTMAHDGIAEGESAVPVVGKSSELPLWCAHGNDVRPEICSFLKTYVEANSFRKP